MSAWDKHGMPYTFGFDCSAATLIAFTYMSTSVIAGEMKDPVGKAHEEMSLKIGKDVRNMLGKEPLGDKNLRPNDSSKYILPG
jgi:predicted membrane chloride channel (bestrophin family)